MSVTDVTSRIGQIQAQLAALAPAATRSSAGSAAAFAASMRGAAPAGTLPPTGTGAAAGGDGSIGDQVVQEARKYLGMPYVWGGSDPSQGGMDCSGLIKYVYEKYGVDLPRVSADQARAGTPVASMAEARPGDLVAWDNSSRNVGADHIAIYVGDGMMIEAPRTGLDIRLVPVPSTPDFIRRVLPDSAPTGPAGPAGVGPVSYDAPVSGAPAATPYAGLFRAAGERYGVDPALLTAVARQESAFDPRAVSPAGAQGLMQLMPGTAAGLGVENPFDPAQAVDGAARLLRDLLQRFGQLDLALAGYNAGPGAVLRYGGVPPYPETQNYVRSILSDIGRS